MRAGGRENAVPRRRQGRDLTGELDMPLLAEVFTIISLPEYCCYRATCGNPPELISANAPACRA
jgi:hypothetical protein